MSNYNNVNDFIKDLISARQDGITINNFNSSYFENFEKSQLWQDLITFLKNEMDQEKLDTSPILQSLFNSSFGVSVYNFINQNCDLNSSEIWNSLKEAMENNIDLSTESGVVDGDNEYFWNESMNKIVAQILSSIDPENGQIYIGKHNGQDVYISINDIKNGNAANDFNNGEWVKPWSNLDEETYSEVRGDDKIISVLNNNNEMQFTNNDKWLKLIMPKYLRKVEVEDLNRNFWVLSQVVSGISAYLFGNDSIQEVLKGLTNELIQLWENVLYLWAAMALISQKDKITDIHIEVVPIANSELQGYIKFDNFGRTATTESWNAIKSRVQYVIDSYPNSNVIVVPQIRSGNYRHNWYYREEYPGLIIFNRNTNQTTTLEFNLGSGQKWPIIDLKQESELVLQPPAESEWLKRLGCLRQVDEFNYEYAGKFSVVKGNTDITDPYYALIRMLPQIQASYDTSNDIISIDSFNLSFYDVAMELKAQQETLVAYLDRNSYPNWDTSTNNTLKIVTIEQTFENVTPDSADPPYSFPIITGFYQGELISYQTILARPRYEVNLTAFYGQRLMKSVPLYIEEYVNGTRSIDDVFTITQEDTYALYQISDIANRLDKARAAEREYLLAIKGNEPNVISDQETVGNIVQLSQSDSNLRRVMDLYILTHRTRYDSRVNHSYSNTYYTSAKNFRQDSENISGITWEQVGGSESDLYKVTDNSGNFYDGHAFSGSVSTAACLINRMTNQTTPYSGYFFQASTPIEGITGSPQRLNNYHLFKDTNDAEISNDNWVIVYAECASANHLTTEPQYNQNKVYENAEGKIVTKIFIHIFTPNGYCRRVLDRSGDIKQTDLDDLSKWTYQDYSDGNVVFSTMWNRILDNAQFIEVTTTNADYSKYWNTGDSTNVPTQNATDISGQNPWSGGVI